MSIPCYPALLRRLTLVGATAAALTACTDRGAAVLTGPPKVEGASLTAYLGVSSSAVLIGDEVVVSGNVRLGTAAPRIGSYLARMAYDPTQLVFLAEVPVAGGARALNPQSGEITVAGAAADGIASERLFAVRFKVIGTKPLAGLQLEMKELNDVAYAVRTPSRRRYLPIYLDDLTPP